MKLPLSLTAFLVSSSLFAGMDIESRMTQMEKEMKQVHTETAMKTHGALTATARPEVDGSGFFILFDLFYWKANVSGTEFGYSSILLPDGIKVPVAAKIKEIEFGYDFGFRAGLGYNFNHDGWDSRLEYTYFDSDGDNSVKGGLNNAVIPLRANDSITHSKVVQKGKSQFDFGFQSLDLDLGRHYFVSRFLSFNPYIGLKSAWIDLEQITRYTGGVQLEANTIHVKEESNFWGLGPRAGFDSRWHLDGGFSIFANFAGALLYGKFDVEHKEKQASFPDNRLNLKADAHKFSPTVQLQIGLRYDTYVNDNKQHVGIGLGYDSQYWWRQNQMLQYDDFHLEFERFSDDVAMHGVTLDLRVDF